LWTLFALRVISATEPFIPLSVLRDGVMRAATGAAFFGVGAVLALTIFLPLYAQVALGLSVSESALSIIALQGAATLTSIVGGRLIARPTHYKRAPAVAIRISIVALPPACATRAIENQQQTQRTPSSSAARGGSTTAKASSISRS